MSCLTILHPDPHQAPRPITMKKEMIQTRNRKMNKKLILKNELSEFPDANIMVAGPPCPPFSSSGIRRRFADERHAASSGASMS